MDFYSIPDSSTASSSVDLATTFYSSSDIKQASLPTETYVGTLLSNGLAALLCLTKTLAEASLKANPDLAVLTSMLDALSLISSVLQREISISWQPQEWMASLLLALDDLDYTTKDFEAASQMVQAVVALHYSPLRPELDIDSRRCIRTIVLKVSIRDAYCRVFSAKHDS